MRYPTEEEKRLAKELERKDLTKEEREEIIKQWQEANRKASWPFV